MIMIQVQNDSSITDKDEHFVGSLYATTQCFCTVIGIAAILFGSFGNGLVFLGAVQNRKLRNKSDILVLNLACADFVLCAILSPLIVYLFFSDPPQPPVYCGIVQFLGSSCALVSLTNVVTVAVHRQTQIVWHRKSMLTTRQAFYIVLSLWIFSSSLSLVGTLQVLHNWEHEITNCQPILNSSKRHSDNFVLFFLGPMCVVSFIIVTVSYTVIACAVQKQCGLKQLTVCGVFTQGNKAITPNSPGRCSFMANGPLPSTYPTPSNEKEIRAITMCLFVTSVILICWGPLIVSQFVELFIGESLVLFQIKTCGVVLIILNSAINPYMYIKRRTTLKAQLKYIYETVVLFCCCCNETKLRAVGKGNLETNRKKCSHFEETNAHSVQSQELLDKCVGPSCTVAQRAFTCTYFSNSGTKYCFGAKSTSNNVDSSVNYSCHLPSCLVPWNCDEINRVNSKSACVSYCIGDLHGQKMHRCKLKN